jgi:RIO kinase 2
MVKNVAGLMADLEPEDFYLLSGVEQGMRFGEWVDRDTLPKYTRLTPENVDYRLDRCLDWGLIERKTIQYEGYKLKFEGYDALALHAFAERGTVAEFGAPLGVGKESDVYEVRSYKPLALKFHREGITNFRKIDRERDYTADREHISMLYTARIAAEREHEILEALYPDVSVPRPIDHNRHAIVMEKMDGVELSKATLPEGQVRAILDMILREVSKAYEAGYVHADMSEYNVFVDEEGITVFDWPQAVATDHENADEFLERDVGNLVRYFRRKHPQVFDAELDASAIARAIADGSFESATDHRGR